MTPSLRRNAGATLLGVAATLALCAAGAAAQTGQPFDPHRPLIVRIGDAPLPGASTRTVAPLDPLQMSMVQEAARAREVGQYDLARRKLAALPDDVQHHPIVLTERARLELDAGNPVAAYQLAATERRAQRDSLLLGHEMVEACERTNRMREASVTAVEVWAVAPVEENWAMSVVTRLSRLDNHASRDAMRKVFAKQPRRADLARGLAYLEWAGGDLPSALKVLRGVEPQERGPRYRWAFAEMLLRTGTQRDSAGAADIYTDVAGDAGVDATYRMAAARRAWDLGEARGQEGPLASRLWQSLKDVPRDRWNGDFAVRLARALRVAGDTGAARALIGAGNGAATPPEMALERSLADLRDGPPERVVDGMKPAEGASDETVFHYAEALFFAGRPDSALTWYQKVAANPGGPYTGAALERIFLIEDGSPRAALPVLGRIAYEQWRGAGKRALALADSLWATLPRGGLWAQTGLKVSEERERAGDIRGALAAALAIADSLPDDRLAPLARQRAGDLYSVRLKDDVHAIEQYEACVARYPRAWNAPEVRRRLEDLRRTRHP